MSRTFWTHWAARFRWQLALISGLTLLSSLATLAIPWLAAQVLGGVIDGGGGASDFRLTLTLLVGSLVCMTALNIAAAIASEVASSQILTQLRKTIFDHVLLLPLRFHEESRGGDVLALTSYEVGNLSDFLAGTLANAPAMILTAFGAFVLLFWLDPGLALVVPVLVPAFYLMARFTGRTLRQLSHKVRAAEVDLIAIAERDLETLPAIKAFATEQSHSLEFARAAEHSRDLAVKKARLNAFLEPVTALLAALAAIGVLVIGGSGLSSGERSAAEFFAFLLYAALLTRPVGKLAGIYGAYQMARGTLARLEAVLNLPPEPGHTGGASLPRSSGAIRMTNVSFAYPGRPQVFENLSLDIRAGETLALTGDNGVGKSTLIRLLLRFDDPDAGTITLDGQNIVELGIQNLRRQFGYVPQRALLFNGTVRDNIVFAQGTHNDEAISRAMRLAQADGFIAALPQGLDTVIGDAGVRLSGGQRQRIALARAIYRDPPILILDEATSMYDLESEAAFVESCLEILRDRTVILITHRPASLALADRIIRVTPDGIVDGAQGAHPTA